MRRALLIGWLAAAALAASPASAQNTWKAGNWNGAPYFNGQQFSHCAMTVNFTDGTQLIVQVTAQLQMFVGASKTNWNMDPTKQYDVVFEVTGGYKKTFKGRVTADRRNTIWFTIGNDPELRRALAGNGTMTWIDAQSARFPFNLAGSDNAMRKLLACAALYGAD
jgi:hypothetical protein